MANGQAQDTSQKKEWKTRNKNRKRILSTRRCRPHRRRLCNYNNCRATRTIQHFRLKIVKSKYIFEILSRSLSLSGSFPLSLSHSGTYYYDYYLLISMSTRLCVGFIKNWCCRLTQLLLYFRILFVNVPCVGSCNALAARRIQW